MEDYQARASQNFCGPVDDTGFAKGDTVFVEANLVYTDNFGKKCKVQNKCKHNGGNNNDNTNNDDDEYWWVDMDKTHMPREGECGNSNNSGKTYEDGMNEVWEIVKALCLDEYEGGFRVRDLEKMFGTRYFDEILMMNIQDVARKVAEWRESKLPHVGDIVINKYRNKPALVMDVNESNDGNHLYSLLYEDFSSARIWGDQLIKTDDRVDGVDAIFKQVKRLLE